MGRAQIVPNPKLKLVDQVREVMRLKHYSIRTERCYCDWIRRYIKFHGMRSREDLQGAEPKIEQFLSDLAVDEVEGWELRVEGLKPALRDCGRIWWRGNRGARRRR